MIQEKRLINFIKKKKYYNEHKCEIERNSKIIKQINDILRDIARHTLIDESEKQLNINCLNRDVECLINLNREYVD